MQYTLQSTKYALKNFLYLFPFAILPAIFLAISTDQAAIDGVLRAFFKGKIGEWEFSDIFRAISVLNFGSWQSIVFGLVGIVVIVPCVALLMALLEKHMRIGKRTFTGLWGKLNDNFISTCGGVFLVLGIYELWCLLLSALLFFLSRITILPLAYVFVVGIFLAMHVLLMIAISTVYLWVPCMQITGFRTYEAFLYSYQLMGTIKLRIVVAQLFVLLFVECLFSVCALFIPIAFAFNVIVALVYACMLIIFCVRMQVAYFDRDHIERADLASYYQR